MDPKVATLALVVSAAAATSSPLAAQGAQFGELHPDVALPTIDGERVVRLSDLRGKKVLLIEFASW